VTAAGRRHGEHTGSRVNAEPVTHQRPFTYSPVMAGAVSVSVPASAIDIGRCRAAMPAQLQTA
jgi:hypothetical protein